MAENKRCWEINDGISPTNDFCRNCLAFKEDKNCWEIEDRPCSNSFATCILVNCPVYLQNKEKIEEKLNKSDLIEIKSRLQTIHDKKCWEFKDCSTEEREICLAYKKKKSCWEVDLCGHKKSDCQICPIYIYHVRFNERIMAK